MYRVFKLALTTGDNCLTAGIIFTMIPTGNPSSSRRKEKAPEELFAALEETGAGKTSLRRVIDQLLEIEPEFESLKAEKASREMLSETVDGQTQLIQKLHSDIDSYKEALEAKDQDNQRLSDQVESYRRRIVRLEGLLKDMFTEAMHVLHSESDPVPLAAPNEAEGMEQANPQLEQPVPNECAEELNSHTTPNDATEGEYQTVNAKENRLAQDTGSKVNVVTGSLSSPNCYRAIDPEDSVRKQRDRSRDKHSDSRPAEQRYVSPLPDTVNTNAQSRTGLRAPNSPLGPLNSPQPEDVGPLTTLPQPESVMNYARMATEPTPYILTTKSLSFGKRLAPIFRKRAEIARAEEAVKTRSREAPEPLEELESSSNEEEEQKPDTSVQTDVEEATSQTRGQYWPKGVL